MNFAYNYGHLQAKMVCNAYNSTAYSMLCVILAILGCILSYFNLKSENFQDWRIEGAFIILFWKWRGVYSRGLLFGGNGIEEKLEFCKNWNL